MKAVSVGVLLRGAFWTLGGFGAGQILRFIMNVIFARLLAPQLFGLMAIVNTVRSGIELISDLGIAQNMIYSRNGDDPDYYNTAWTLQAVRSVILFLVIVAVSAPLARFYELPILSYLLSATGVNTILLGFSSISLVLLQKKMMFAKLNTYQLTLSLVLTPFLVLIVYMNRTIWALIWGAVLSSVVGMVTSYFLLPDVRQRFTINKKFAREIIEFGKWISISSIVYFLSTNFDRLYFAKVVPLEVFGIYSIARSISELLNTTTGRLGNSVVFPFVASHSDMPRETLRSELVSTSRQIPSPRRYWLLAANRRLRSRDPPHLRSAVSCSRVDASGPGRRVLVFHHGEPQRIDIARAGSAVVHGRLQQSEIRPSACRLAIELQTLWLRRCGHGPRGRRSLSLFSDLDRPEAPALFLRQAGLEHYNRDVHNDRFLGVVAMGVRIWNVL